MPSTTLHRPVKSHRMVWLAEIEPVIAHAPDLAAILRPAFDAGYAKGATVVKIPESDELRIALAAVRA